MSKSMYADMVRQFINDKQFPKEFTACDVYEHITKRPCSKADASIDTTLSGIQDWLSHNIDKVEYFVGTVVERYRKAKRNGKNYYFKTTPAVTPVMVQVDRVTDIILNEFIACQRTIHFGQFISKVFGPNYDPKKAEQEILEVLHQFPSYVITEIECEKVAYPEAKPVAPVCDKLRWCLNTAQIIMMLWPDIKDHYASLGITEPIYDEDLDAVRQKDAN